ncbi:MAG: divergent PAP2 family protein [bacterium]|nr:divergent PAP2 family protein [bacterium]
MSYQLFIIPIIAALIAQGLKLALDGIKGNFDFMHLISEYGGMPSSHTAFVISLATMIALKEGMASSAFAISLIMALIVIRDAIGFRRTLGKQSKTLNYIVRELSEEKKREHLPKLPEEIGHNPLEVFVGGLLGLSISLLANLLLK